MVKLWNFSILSALDEDLDVVNIEKDEMQPLVTYNVGKAMQAMTEVECYLNSLWKDTDKMEDDKISK